MTATYLDYIHALVKPLTAELTRAERRNKSAIILAVLQGSPLVNRKGVSNKFQKNIVNIIYGELSTILTS